MDIGQQIRLQSSETATIVVLRFSSAHFINLENLENENQRKILPTYLYG